MEVKEASLLLGIIVTFLGGMIAPAIIRATNEGKKGKAVLLGGLCAVVLGFGLCWLILAI